jgi:uncharacterized protein YuzE
MQVILTEEFSEIEIINAAYLRNTSDTKIIELVIVEETPEKDTGLLILPKQKILCTPEVNLLTYARCYDTISDTDDDVVLEVDEYGVAEFVSLDDEYGQKLITQEERAIANDVIFSNSELKLDDRLICTIIPSTGRWGNYIDTEWIGVDISDAVGHGVNDSYTGLSGMVKGSNLYGTIVPGEDGHLNLIDGKALVKQNWSSATHSFICLGVLSNNEIYGAPYQCDEDNSEAVEKVTVPTWETSKHNNRKTIFLISSSFQKVLFDDEELDVAILNQGVTSGIFRIGRSAPYNIDQIGGIFVYEGSLTEDELRYELQLIENDLVSIDDPGIYEMIPFAKQIPQLDGTIKDYYRTYDPDLEFPYIEGGLYEYTALNGDVTVDIVQSGSIIGAGNIIIEDGFIKINSAVYQSYGVLRILK